MHDQYGVLLDALVGRMQLFISVSRYGCSQVLGVFINICCSTDRVVRGGTQRAKGTSLDEGRGNLRRTGGQKEGRTVRTGTIKAFFKGKGVVLKWDFTKRF